MITPFLKETAEQLIREYKSNLHRLLVVLPGQRAALHLKSFLKKAGNAAFILPQTITIEEFTEEISGLMKPDSITLSIELYKSWKKLNSAQEQPNDKNSGDTLKEFFKWSGIVLHDFNEIDSSMADADDFFSNLKDIKQIENWSLGENELTDFQRQYIEFMNQLGRLYHEFRGNLLKNNLAWPGLINRIAAEKIETAQYINRFDKIVFVGFNALNKCEKKIFNFLQKNGKGDFLWDMDEYYLNDEKQEAGLFLRHHFRETGEKPKNFLHRNLLSEKKDIKIIAAPGYFGQAGAAATQLKEWSAQASQLNHSAVILADESLLFPLLNTIPSSALPVNITLEYPIKRTPIYDLFELIIQWQSSAVQKKSNNLSIYHKDFFRLFYNQSFRFLFNKKEHVCLQKLFDIIVRNNINFISSGWLLNNSADVLKKVEFIFDVNKDAVSALKQLSKLCQLIIDTSNDYGEQSNSRTLEITYLQAMKKAIGRLHELIAEYPEINDIPSVYHLLREIISKETVSFSGEPLEGLQLMGVLETRTLDFEKLIIVGLNEGILPAGKSSNSFIPSDLKKYFGLPGHYEKDAVYAYHFYRLLQRAKEICLIYNTETDTFGSGEKSRFLTQLLFELPKKNQQVIIHEFIGSASLNSPSENEIYIPKNPETRNSLLNKLTGKYGLSASSINMYKECKLKFWFRHIANLDEQEEINDDMQSSVFGSILHKALENLYRPLESTLLHENNLNWDEQNIREEVMKAYAEHYPEDKDLKGKNLLAINIIVQYVKKMRNIDIERVQQLAQNEKKMQLMKVEQDLFTSMEINWDGGNSTVNFSGKIDRTDLTGNQFRIIDYKTSIYKDNFIFTNTAELFEKTDNNKLFQLFFYAWMFWKNKIYPADSIYPCIIPFKNYGGTPEYILDPEKNILQLSDKVLSEFEFQLIKLIDELKNPNVPFSQTTDEKICEYCSYNTICNRKSKEK